MTPWRAWKLYRSARRFWALIEGANAMSKPWWKSKTVLVNLLSAAAELTGIIPLPGGTALLVANILNIALRFMTTGPTHLVSPAE